MAVGRPLGSMVVSLGLDSVKFTDGLKSIQNQFRLAKSEMRANMAELSSTGTAYEKASAKVEGLTKIMDINKRKIESLRETYQKQVEMHGEYSTSAMRTASKINDAIRIQENYRRQLNDAKVAMNEAKRGTDTYKDSLELLKRTTKADIEMFNAQGKSIKALKTEYRGLQQEINLNKKILADEKTKLKELMDTKGADAKETKLQKATVTELNSTIKQQKTELNNIRLSMNEAKRGTDSLRTSLETLQKTTTASITGLQAQGKTNEANLVKYRSLKEEIQQYNRILDDEKAKLKELVNAKGADARETQEQKVKVAELNSKIQQSQASYDSMNSKYKNMTTAQAQAKDSVNKLASSYKSMGNSVKSAGQKLTGFSTVAGIGLVAGLKTSISSLSEFKNTLNEIKNLAETGGESASEATRNVARIQKDATQYSNQYGVSVNKIGDGYKELIKRGYTTEQALGAMKSELQASVASGDDFQEVVSVSSQVLDSFGMKVNSTSGMMKNTKLVTNEIAYAADATSTSFSDLGIGMSYAGASAKTAKVELSETAAAMGILSNNGLEADKAGTGLRDVLNHLTKGIANIDSKNSVLAKLGIKKEDLVDAKGNMRSLSDVFEVINSKVKGMKSPEKAAIFNSLFGTTGQQAGIILANNAKELDKLNKKVKEAPKKNYVGALSEKNMKSAQNQMKIFKQSATNMGMSLAEVLLPPLSKVAASLSKFFQWVAQLPKPIKSTIVGVTLLAVAIGPLLVALGSMITAIGTIKKVMTGLSIAKKVKEAMSGFSIVGMLTNPITIGIAAVVALGTAFVVAYQKIKPFRDFVNGIGATVKKEFDKVKNVAKDIWTVLSSGNKSKNKAQANMNLSKIFSHEQIVAINNFGKNLRTTINGIKKTISGAKTITKDIFNLFTSNTGDKKSAKAFNSLNNLLPKGSAQKIVSTINTIKMAFNGLFALFKGDNARGENLLNRIFPKSAVTYISTITKIIRTDFNLMKSAIVGVFKSIWSVISPIFNKIGGGFKSLIKGMSSYFNKYGKNIMQAFVNIFDFILVKVVSKFTLILTAISVAMKSIQVVISAALDLVKNIFSSVWISIENVLKNVFQIIGGLLEIFAGIFTGNWKLFWQGVKDTFFGIIKTFVSAFGGVINTIIGIVNSGIDGINWLITKFGVKKIGHIPSVKWATGTTRYYPNGLPETQLAMVNDGGKREAIVYPNGQVGMFKGMNVTTILPKGSHVINGDDTEKLGLANYPDMHYYAKGTISFGSIWNGIKSGASKLWDDVSDGVKLAKNIVSHPIEALESAFSGSLKIGKSVQFAIDTAKGLGSFIIKNIKNGIVKEIKKWIDSNEDEGDSNSTSPKPTGSHKHWMKQAGIPKSWYEDLNWIINHESGWRVNATNPGSGAYGIPQSLPGNKMASAGKDWRTNPITQLKWMYSYVKGRYGNASNAKHFWQTHNWYANGGFVTQEQIAHIAEGNRPEAIIPLTNRTRAMQILAQVRDKYGLSAGNVVLSGGKQDNTDLSSLERKFDTVISLLGQIAGLSAEQVNALKAMKPSQNFDKNKFYQDMFRDQTISNYMNM
ncbi:phage tail tape measure protein [Ligilactobacillus salivarius]|uniref:phage tail tape measure protein n=1 Tax=Ligilactobacillus salivarius TaxID=1624 RepID=UPI001F1D35A9|nr:phage tail tape measure protein [Ligilactobacillus salivarius]